MKHARVEIGRSIVAHAVEMPVVGSSSCKILGGERVDSGREGDHSQSTHVPRTGSCRQDFCPF